MAPGFCDAHWMHEWIRAEYKSAVEKRGLEYCLTDKRVNLLVDTIVRYSNQYQCDVLETMTLFTIESSFVNRIGDRNLPEQRWCFGYGQVQTQTASMVWGRHVTGNELLNDVDLNIHTAIRHYDWLCAVQTKERAIRAYNAGLAGMRKGRGKDYYKRFDETIRRMEKFYAKKMHQDAQGRAISTEDVR